MIFYHIIRHAGVVRAGGSRKGARKKGWLRKVRRGVNNRMCSCSEALGHSPRPGRLVDGGGGDDPGKQHL